jgi:uncharacterized membrane protein HdeD (DUF308 family)
LQAQRKQPKGVTILGILGIIGGIFGLIVGIALVIIGPFFGQVSETDMANILEDEELSINSTDMAFVLNELKKLSGPIFIIGIFLILEGIASIIVGWGLLRGKGWAWFGAVILTIISILFNIVIIAFLGVELDPTSIGGTIVGFTIYGIILWYLYRQNVRSYFGRVKIQAP